MMRRVTSRGTAIRGGNRQLVGGWGTAVPCGEHLGVVTRFGPMDRGKSSFEVGAAKKDRLCVPAWSVSSRGAAQPQCIRCGLVDPALTPEPSNAEVQVRRLVRAHDGATWHPKPEPCHIRREERGLAQER